MDRFRQQHAEARGHGNVVVQVAGDGNNINWQPDKPALWLTTYDSSPLSEVPTVPPQDGPQPGYTATGKEEASLLSPFTRSLTLLGRDDDLRSLTAWLDAPARISVQVMVGDGGRGKTRLALELCAAAAKRQWLAGFAVAKELDRFWQREAIANWGWNKPVLAVVDYAAAKAAALHGWLSELIHHRAWNAPDYPPLRLLLLERHGDPAAAWWRAAFGDGGPVADAIAARMVARGAPIRLGPIANPYKCRAIFAEAHRLACGTDPPPTADLDRQLAAQSLGGEPLFLAMSGLLAAREGMATALAQTPDMLAIRLAKGELARIGAIWAGHGLEVHKAKPLHTHLAALATLCGGLAAEAAHAAIERECAAMRLPAQAGTEPIRAALHEALPGETDAIAPILPDILGEAAMIAAWGEGKQGLEAIRRAAADHRETVTPVVVRACQDFLIRGHRAPLAWLRELRDSVTDIEALVHLMAAMPEATTELRETALEVTQAIADAAAALVERDASEAVQALRAVALNNLSNRLADLGRREAALAAIEEAVAIRRTLAQARPDAFLPDLASSLNNLSIHLADLGRREAALAAIAEAVAIRRTLAQARPDAFRPDLATSLNNLSLRLADLGRREAALAAIEEAVATYRTLAQARPDAFRPDLATSLNNLSLRLADLGRREAALAAIEGAVATRRTLAQARPDAFRPDLASSLNNLSNCLAGFGRRKAALAAIEEAVATYRTLAQARPDAFLPDLALSLNNLSNRLGALGRREAALAAIEEAVAIRRTLAQARPDAFLPGLARSLGARGHILAPDTVAAAASFLDGIKALAGPFLALPQAFAPLMQALCREYIAACEASSQAPETAVLAPIVARLAELGGNEPDA